MHWDYGYGMGNGWGMGFGWLFMFVSLVLLALCAVYVLKLILGPAAKREQVGETPLQILKRRYARGEITREEYQGIRKDLES